MLFVSRLFLFLCFVEAFNYWLYIELTKVNGGIEAAKAQPLMVNGLETYRKSIDRLEIVCGHMDAPLLPL